MFDDLGPSGWTEVELSEEEQAEREERRQASYEFYRQELRQTKSERTLDCNCYIPPRFEYLYSVWKLFGIKGIGQSTICEACARRESHNPDK